MDVFDSLTTRLRPTFWISAATLYTTLLKLPVHSLFVSL